MPDNYESIRSMSDEDLIKRIWGDYKNAVSDKRVAHNRCNRYTDIYRATDPDEMVVDEETGKLTEDRAIYSNTYLPIGAAVVDTAASAIYNAFFSDNDYFEIDGADPIDDEIGQRITKHMKIRHKEMQFRWKIYKAVQMALIYDYSVTLTKWRLEPGYIPKRNIRTNVIDLGGVKMREREIAIEDEWIPDSVDRPDVELFDYFNCYHDSGSKHGFEDSDFFIDVREEVIERLIEQRDAEDRPMGRYRNIDKVIKSMLEHSMRIDPSMTEEERLNQIFRRRVTIVRYWTRHHVAEMCGGHIILRQDLNGWPLTQWKIYNLPNKFEGMGILQRMERSQYDINAIINVRRDHQNLMMNPIAVIDEELVDLNDGKVELYPGKVLLSQGGMAKDKVFFYQPGNLTANAMEELTIQVDMVQNLTGFGDNQMGNFSQGRKTARETSAVASGALGKVMTVALNLEETCLEPIYLQQFRLEQRYLRQEAIFKYRGKHAQEWVQLRPSDYKYMAQPRFIAKGTAIVKDKAIHIQQFMAAAQYALMAPQFHNLPEIFRELWKLLVPMDYERFLAGPKKDMLNIPPQLEDYMFSQGNAPEVSPLNDHGEHIAQHTRTQSTVDFQMWPETQQRRHAEHIKEHEAAAQQQQIQQRGMMQQQDASDADRGMRGGQLPQLQGFLDGA